MNNGSIKNKAIKGVGWSAVDNVAQYAVTFVVTIVLARLLTPDDYGLLGIIAIFTAVCNAIINGGFGTAIIRKKEATDDDYNTAFIVNIIMSLFLYMIVYVFSPQIASFFNRTELTLLTRVSSVGIIIGSLSLVQQTRLTKRIDFKTQTKITVIASISSGLVGVVMALYNFGVWALVSQSLFSTTARTILFWIYNKWIPQFRFSFVSFKELFGFGWKIMLSGVIDTIWKELYQVVVGKYYSPASLGQYTRAKQFSQLFSSNLTNVIQRVTYPVLSDIQDEQNRMVQAYRRIIKITMFITAISMFVLGAMSEPLLYCLIGPKWHDAAVYLPLICITGSFYPLHAINLNMLQLQGRSDLFLGLEIIKKVVAILPLAVGAFVGILPMLYVSILTSIIAFFFNSHYSGKLIGYSSFAQIKDVLPSYIVALVISVPIFLVKYLYFSYWVLLPLQIILLLVLLIIIYRYVPLEEIFEIKSVMRPFVNKIQRFKIIK